MTDRLTALKELDEFIGKGMFPADMSARDLGLAGIVIDSGVPVMKHMYAAFSGSLDAAMALHEAVLGDRFLVTSMSIRRPLGETHWRVMLGQGYKTYPDTGPNIDIECGHTVEWNCFARAWLLAIIRALIAELETE